MGKYKVEEKRWGTLTLTGTITLTLTINCALLKTMDYELCTMN